MIRLYAIWFLVFQVSDPRAAPLRTVVNETDTQATGLENTPGVMNVEQADEATQKSALALEGDDDSDQDDFTSPGKNCIQRNRLKLCWHKLTACISM